MRMVVPMVMPVVAVMCVRSHALLLNYELRCRLSKVIGR
ncbi:hypothetical protein RM6536_1540 [Rothia mucilaginosa]|uniref:Uncharacterized protein n=1 Tax=Rothia mucilaginosa TaxID=43675 RepID=A0A0K2S1V2_9MICC|nr:hypothetical protein RM6536_1540 [Rothia mucilaginosa]